MRALRSFKTGLARFGPAFFCAFQTSAMISDHAGSTVYAMGIKRASGRPSRKTRNRSPCRARSSNCPVFSCSIFDVTSVTLLIRHLPIASVNPDSHLSRCALCAKPWFCGLFSFLTPRLPGGPPDIKTTQKRPKLWFDPFDPPPIPTSSGKSRYTVTNVDNQALSP